MTSNERKNIARLLGMEVSKGRKIKGGGGSLNQFDAHVGYEGCVHIVCGSLGAFCLFVAFACVISGHHSYVHSAHLKSTYHFFPFLAGYRGRKKRRTLKE